MIEGLMYRSPKRNRLYTRAPLADRFWPKVQKTEGCWLWIGCRDGRGYGQLQSPGRSAGRLKAHRVSWLLHHGPIPDGLLVRHRCDNPPCVRPDHLELGTQADNAKDAARRGRLVFQQHPERCPRGERAPGAKLTVAQVEEIRRLRSDGWTQCRLAHTFGVSQAAIWDLLHGHTWRKLVVSDGRGAVRAAEELFGP
jgi:hypothetical protein